MSLVTYVWCIRDTWYIYRYCTGKPVRMRPRPYSQSSPAWRAGGYAEALPYITARTPTQPTDITCQKMPTQRGRPTTQVTAGNNCRNPCTVALMPCKPGTVTSRHAFAVPTTTLALWQTQSVTCVEQRSTTTTDGPRRGIQPADFHHITPPQACSARTRTSKLATPCRAGTSGAPSAAGHPARCAQETTPPLPASASAPAPPATPVRRQAGSASLHPAIDKQGRAATPQREHRSRKKSNAFPRHKNPISPPLQTTEPTLTVLSPRTHHTNSDRSRFVTTASHPCVQHRLVSQRVVARCTMPRMRAAPVRCKSTIAEGHLRPQHPLCTPRPPVTERKALEGILHSRAPPCGIRCNNRPACLPGVLAQRDRLAWPRGLRCQPGWLPTPAPSVLLQPNVQPTKQHTARTATTGPT